jgi:hypothetical protein
MSRGELAIVIVLGTFAFAMVLGGVASLRESEEREKELRLSDFDPTGATTFFSTFARVLFYTQEWKQEHRLALSLFWAGVVCGAAAGAVALLA